MKLFPERKYNVRLEDEILDVMPDLINVTKLSDSLISEWTSMEFIGQVKESSFKIISSEIGRGAFCILKGEFEGKKGILDIRIHKAFRVLLSIIFTFPFIGFGIMIFQKGLMKSLVIIAIIFIFFLFIRFVYIELIFRIVSKKGLNKLKKTLRIKQIDLIQHS